MASNVSRAAEVRAVIDLFAAATTRPAALIVEGEAGIGKTTMWLATLEQARARGFRVLSARPSEAESVLAYGTLADLLGGLDESALAHLPAPQRRAADRILLRGNDDAPFDAAVDPRAVGAAFVSVVEGLAVQSPVLIALDDLQWMDTSSVRIAAYALRRLSGPVGVLATARSEPGSADAASWLELPGPEDVRRMRLASLSVGGLHAIITERIGRSMSRRTMVQIHEVSGGNPFYALELARAIDDAEVATDARLPGSLTELVRARIERLDAGVVRALLAAACLAAPTVELVTAALGGDGERVAAALGAAEDAGIVTIVGHRLSYVHPLLARGVYTTCSPSERRRMHARLAELVSEPELRARHRALAATSGDPETLRLLDAGAESARLRGAPAAAAELLELAMGLGGATDARHIALASCLHAEGEVFQAKAILQALIGASEPGPVRAHALTLLAGLLLFDNSFVDALTISERAIGETRADSALRMQAMVTRAYALFNTGQAAEAMAAFDDVARNAESSGEWQLLAQALTLRALLGFLQGDGVDEPTVQRALDLEQLDSQAALAFCPSMQNGQLLIWTGRHAEARAAMQALRRICIERGDEFDQLYAEYYLVMNEVMVGNFADAELVAEDAFERALQLGGDIPLCGALTMRGCLAAYAGRVDDARRDLNEAIALSHRCGSVNLREWPTVSLGFLELSVGNHAAVLTATEPLKSRFEASTSAEMAPFMYIPDAVEALVNLGRLADAEPLVARFERIGRRLDRAWTIAMGARGRAMLLAAAGDVDAAIRVAQASLSEFDRLPMPFERARTQLLVGQLQRRQRRKNDAARTLGAALDVFEGLGTPLWADRARAELSRSSVGPHRSALLTPSEQRVADLAASGRTNREVAAALFISPKTVDVNIGRIYRKLGIRTRAELGQRMATLDHRQTPDSSAVADG